MTTSESIRQRAESNAKTYGYHLNPDPEFLMGLLEGLKRNEERYGYLLCPCRLASGKFEFDRDIICPCDYRDPDVREFGCCYCALYVRKDVFEGETPVSPIPERRPVNKQVRAYETLTPSPEEQPLKSDRYEQGDNATPRRRMWFCRQCGYVCFRDDPPLICPICSADQKLFAGITISTQVEG